VLALLLDIQYNFIKEQSITSVIILIGAICVVLLIFFLGYQSSRSSARSTGENGRSVFKRRVFRRVARNMGLTKQQTQTLENLVTRYRIGNPYIIFSNTSQLDFILKKGMKEIDEKAAPEEIKEAEKLSLFRVKQAIERNYKKKQVISTTRQLRSNQEVIIQSPTGEKYPSRVSSNLKDVLAIEVPKDRNGEPIRWKKWTPVKIFFWKPNGEGFSFTSKTMGYNNVGGSSSLLIQHKNNIIKAGQRRFRRKEVEKPVYFYKINIIETGIGKEKRKRAVVNEKGRILGTMLDISSGGCSIKTNHPLDKDSLIKIEFETERRNMVTVFGKVRHLRRSAPLGGIMHIMFTRISKRNLNKINTYVYDIA